MGGWGVGGGLNFSVRGIPLQGCLGVGVVVVVVGGGGGEVDRHA